MTDKKKITNATINLDATAEGHRLEDATPEEKAELAATCKQFADTVTELHRATLKEIVQPIFDMLQNEDFQTLLKDAEARENVLRPFIESVLQDPKNQNKYKGITAAQVLENLDIMGRVINPEELTAEILKRAQKTKRAAEAREIQRAGQKNAKPKTSPAFHYARRDKETKLSTTKLTQCFFDPFPNLTPDNGQLKMPIDYFSKDAEKTVVLDASFSIDYAFLEEHGITEINLDYGYGYFVMSILDQLRVEGNRQTTPTQILKRMGIPASTKEIEKLIITLLTGLAITTTINNKRVLDAWGIDTKNYQEIISRVMPISIDNNISRFDGNLSKITINIENVSPFYRVSAPLKHLASWDNKLFLLYEGRKTTKYWRVMRYLAQQIAWMRNDKSTERSNKLKLETIYDYVGDRNTHQKNATKALVWDLLQKCFAPLHYIDGNNTIEEPATGDYIIKPISNEQREKLLLKEQQKNKDEKLLNGKNQK